MSSTESEVDFDLLERMLDWASDIEEFERHHAVDGLFNAKGFSMPSSLDEEGFLLLALDIAFWFWIDDRSDKHIKDQANPVNWDRIIDLADGVSETAPLIGFPGHEETFFVRLRDALRAYLSNKPDHDYWLQTMSRVARGMRFEEHSNRSGRMPSYIECLEYGIGSSTIPNIIATTALVHDVSRAARQGDLILVDLERCFCMQQRMLNDLHSAKKERNEGAHGKTTNILLLIEKLIGNEHAEEFVRNEISSLEGIIESMFNRLDDQDPFVRLIRHSMKTINAWLKSRPTRYQD